MGITKMWKMERQMEMGQHLKMLLYENDLIYASSCVKLAVKKPIINKKNQKFISFYYMLMGNFYH